MYVDEQYSCDSPESHYPIILQFAVFTYLKQKHTLGESYLAAICWVTKVTKYGSKGCLYYTESNIAIPKVHNAGTRTSEPKLFLK